MNPADTDDRLLLAGCWLTYGLAMAASGGLAGTLAPWQHPLAYAALGVLAVLIAGAWWGRRGATRTAVPMAGADLVLATLVHLLPLFLLAGVGLGSLGGQALRTPARVTGHQAAADPPPTAGAPLRTIADLYAGDRLPSGPITLEGRIYHLQEADRERLPGLDQQHDRLLLYRFLIICCAADASPVYAALDGVEPAAVTDDAWIRVTGVVTAGDGEAGIMRIAVDAWQPIDELREPYLQRSF